MVVISGYYKIKFNVIMFNYFYKEIVWKGKKLTRVMKPMAYD